MKKKLFIALIIILLITGCKNKNKEAVEEAQKKVNEQIKNVENISSQEINKIIDYISENIDSVRKNSKNYKEFVEKATFITTICNQSDSLKDKSSICEIGELTNNYLKSFSKKDLDEIKKLLEKVKDNDNVKDFVNEYHQTVSVDNNLKEIEEKVAKEAKVEDFITKDKINKALDFIENNYKKPFESSESLYKILYYTEYLNKVGTMKKNTQLTELSKLVRKQISEPTEKTKKEIATLIETINKKRDTIIKELL